MSAEIVALSSRTEAEDYAARQERGVAHYRRYVVEYGPAKAAACILAVVGALPAEQRGGFVGRAVQDEPDGMPTLLDLGETEKGIAGFVASFFEQGPDVAALGADMMVKALPAPQRHRLLIELARLYCLRRLAAPEG